jgi:hypothetical protein
MLPAMISAIVLSVVLLAQATPFPVTTEAPAPMTPVEMPINQPIGAGQCLDSPRPVPKVLQPPIVRAMQVVRIDKVESTASMMPGEVLGYLYTLADGSTWLGQRSNEFMSAASATQINTVLASLHLPTETVTAFPPQMKHGVATKYQQFFQVQVPPNALSVLRIQIVPCVLWPAARPLPDPSM